MTVSPFRSSARSETPRVFGATSVCVACWLRFAPRKACPECGDPRPISLGTRDGRATFALRQRRARAVGLGFLSRLAAWAPARPWATLAVVVLLVSPASVMAWSGGKQAFLNTWLMDDLTLRHEGLSEAGLGLLAFAALGVILGVFTVLACAGARQVERADQAPRRRMRIHAPAPADEDVVEGVARKSTITLPSPVGKVDCLAFALRATTPEADVADAEGGDFDVELANGDRVMISLEHAVVLADEAPEVTVAVDEELAELLEGRGIVAGASLAVAELVIRDGARVRVSGKRIGASVTVGRRARGQVMAGDEDGPLAITLL